MNKRVGAAAVIKRHFQNGETTCRQLSKRLPDNSTIFAAEATAISLTLNYYQHMGPIHHDVVVYSDSMSCVQAIEGEDTENPFICHIMNLPWLLSDKGTHVRFCWIPSHRGIEGNILSRGPPTGCHHCGQTLTIDHMLLECALLQECRDEYYTVDSLNALFETIPETCIVEFLREAGFFYLIWCSMFISTSPQYWTIWSDLSNCLENESKSETHSLV